MKKSATQTRKQCLDQDPADHSVGAMDNSGAAGAANDQDLAELVCKHFREEITQALQEAQQALTPQKGRSARATAQKT